MRKQPSIFAPGPQNATRAGSEEGRQAKEKEASDWFLGGPNFAI